MMQGNRFTNWSGKRELFGWRYRAANRSVVKTVGNERATMGNECKSRTKSDEGEVKADLEAERRLGIIRV